MKGHYFEQQDKQDVHSVDSNYSASQSRPSRYETMAIAKSNCDELITMEAFEIGK